MDTIMTVSAGGPAIRQIELAYKANLPVLMHGKHGVGKSELFHRAAADLGVSIVVRDLSLMEPPDLIGIPRVDSDGRTRYAPPAFLPTEAKGLLVFEELNRAPRYVVAPCLQLLTARALNDYRLPPGWVPCAAVNDIEDGYLVEELDAALLARFVRFRIQPDRKEWCTWARHNRIHPDVLSFVEGNPHAFDEPQANPRAWSYVSNLLHAGQGCSADDLAVAVAGLVGETWSGAFMGYTGDAKPLGASQVVDDYPAYAACMKSWKKKKRTDLLAASWTNLRHHLQRQASFDTVLADPTKKKNVEKFLRDLVPDLRKQACAWFEERGLWGLSLPNGGA